jgi:O-antigen ligase
MSLPGLPLRSFGAVGNESAALFLAIGTICFLVRLASGSVRFRDVLGLVPVVICVVLASERAVLLNLVAVLAVIGLALLIGHRHGIARRFRLTSQQIGRLVLGILAAVSAVLLVVVVPAALDRRAARIPLVSSLSGLFHSQGKVESARDRVTLASVAESMIHQHPVIGWGLGVKFQYYEAGSRSTKTIAYAHNVVLDIWLRVGIIGVVLFVVALAVSFVGGLRVWRRNTDPVTAALALALIAVLTGLLVTAFLEPLIDEYRLATLFGVSLGMLRATVTTPLGPAPTSTFGRPELGAGLAPVGGGRWGQGSAGRP